MDLDLKLRIFHWILDICRNEMHRLRYGASAHREIELDGSPLERNLGPGTICGF